MIGTISIKCNAAHPEIALPTINAYAGSPSSIRITDVPKKIGQWQITEVSIQAQYPDETTVEIPCVLVGGAWVGTLPKTIVTGLVQNGFTIYASGTDENGDDVTGYVLGKGDINILDAGTIPQASYFVKLYDEQPESPKSGNLYKDGDDYVIWQDGEANAIGVTHEELAEKVDESELENYYNKTEVDSSLSEINDELATKADKSEIPDISGLATKTYVDNELDLKADKTQLNAYVPLSGNVVIGGDIEFASDKSIILPMDYINDTPQFTYSLYGRSGSTGRHYRWFLKAHSGQNQTIANMSDVEASLIPKLDAEEYTPTRIIPIGIYWWNGTDIEASDLIVDSSGEFTNVDNTYVAELDEQNNGFWIKCTYSDSNPNRMLIENDTKGTSTRNLNTPIWFDIGDVGTVDDGDGDDDAICIAENIVEELPTVRLTVGQSIENRLANYYTKSEVDAQIGDVLNTNF